MYEGSNVPPPLPSIPPPPPPPLPPPPPVLPGGASPDRNVMIVLSYLGPLALVPLLAQNDREVQWHAKQGLVLLGAWVVVFVVFALVQAVIGVVSRALSYYLFAVLYPLLGLASLGVAVACMLKGINGERLRLPFLAEIADKL